MRQEVLLTTRDLKIIDATDGCRDLARSDSIQPGEMLLAHFPVLEKLLTKKALFEGAVFENTAIGDDLHTVRIIPAQKHIIFLFQGQDAPPPSDPAALPQIDALHERTRLLETIIEDAPIGLMLLNENGKMLYMNKKQEENSQRKREKLVDRNIRDIYRKAFEFPQMQEFFDLIVSQKDLEVTNHSLIIDHYYPQYYKRDMIIKFLASRLIEHKKIVVFVEIEDELYREKRKSEKAGEELRMSQTYLARLLDASPNMVISVDDKRRIVSFNKTAERMLGFKAADVYNTPLDRFFPKEEHPKLELAISSQVLWYGTSHLIRSDRSSFPIELYSTKIKDDQTGKEIATLFLAVDTEERNLLRKNLIQSQKMNFIGELASSLAHQLNNPLVGVVNIADVLIKKMSPDDDNYARIKMIREAGESCKEVISRLLKFSRRQENAPMASIDLRYVLDAAIDLLLKHPKFKGVHVEKLFKDVPMIKGDLVLLQQAFMNMLVNSAQALRDGGVIKVACRPAMRTPRQVVVSITDNGCGIPAHDLPRVFDPFFSTKNADDGTGIGLSLTYWIIQDHGGRIGVESTPGKGTKFTVYLPMKQ